MREREDLSLWEQKYISKKIIGWKILSVFLPWLWLIWSKRRKLFWRLLWISLWLALLCGVAWDSELTQVVNGILFIVTIVLTLVKFTEKAYKHDATYFQRYLDEYQMINWWDAKVRKKESTKNEYDSYWFDKDWYNREWYDAYWFDREGYNRDWYNEEWFDKNWFDKNGYNYKWFDRNWFDRNGYDRRWFDKDWYDKDGYDEYWDKKKNNKKNSK